ncbi:Na+/H+ antiporter NhaC family protein [Eubacterium sp. AB3007]|uniref:Na+/H+ antiporter NhaC family protein n=1 Tax=Eubacterium sp. AB3007 TaxID=1392487 RepID=UPI0005573A3A|nr:Na+/H+ antiporter NhaC family protein [Eubacterium sp. AB3007]
MNKTPRAKALLPILIFLILYLGSGIYYEYISPQMDDDGNKMMGFYIMSVVVSFVIALIVAFLQNRELSFDQKIHACAKGIGDDNITIMLFIFLMAGMFSGVAKASGGADSTAYMLLDVIPANFAIPCLFLIACLISMAMGTSVGTISVLVPIAAAVASSAHLNLPFCVATVVGGAMFGDNLSFISDTTIAATKTQGCEMKDKFRVNFKIALPAAAITLGILIVKALSAEPAAIEHFDYNVIQALPYFAVLIASLCGINVFIVLGCGTILSFIAGLATGTLTVPSAFSAMGAGTSGMFETMIVTILVASMGALMKEYGGFEFILQTIKKAFNSRKGGMLGIGLLTGLMDIATANNTVAIVMSAPIAKDIAEEFGIEPKRTASLMDTFSCVFQGLIPYGAQLLIAASLAGITSVAIMPFLYYQFLLLLCVLVAIFLDKGSEKA